jgi:hypothetical protein
MNCPFCTFDGSRRQVHAHLLAAHGERITARPNAQGGPAVAVDCPFCAQQVSVPFDARDRPDGLREEVEGAARMVLFDLLLYHVEGDHPAD